ncbi:putative ATP-dependent helicase/deoxyribonuclease subunit B [Selenomonas ruminantium subsp. lactilytica TAM6421]|uniref:Putative ATP-dependent helicase/deoxyribonuclease subunit B n=1 Tax=Selenomonas ruminantium subsp. lactilytica (strain NBRC 103574 / TAM6421) TaxID=927704 RepID=I0GP76_SELRL|nr:helicase-exonuclease AddAB subunit AddB [Selenomonas ruminantium]BAL82563.1 putative ATP-dependent helicase/deoxyribonuclease subunit B [Selenomonas ruminantium subsp. lactilytica TAM6421]
MTATLDFIIGRSGTGKTHACLTAMQKKMTAEPLGPALILLLPEHMTYKAERELATMMEKNGQGFFRAYVFGFRRFARQILLETGGGDMPRISDVGRRLLLQKLLLKHQKDKDLTVFARAARQRGFTETLSDAIKEIKSYRLTTDTLRQAADMVGTGQERLSGKVRELSTLADEFAAAMDGRTNDAEDLMNILADKIPQAELMQGAEVWIDGFVFFNPQEMNVLAAILSSAAKVHITLPLTGEHLPNGQVNFQQPENTNETGLFNRPYRTMENICRLLQEMESGQSGFWQPVTLLTENHRAKNPALGWLEKTLFGQVAEYSEKVQGLRLVEAANRRIELETVAADILRLVREEDYRYREIGVLIRNAEDYDGVLPLVFQDYGIPFFQDGKRQSIHHPLAELLRSALEVVQRGWNYENIFRCLRTGFFPLVRDDVDKLENYVLEFGIRGRKRWLQAEDWRWHRRYSLDTEEEEVDAETQERLQLIDGLRRQAVEALRIFDQSIRQAENVTDQITALYDFLVALEVPAHLVKWQEVAENEGRMADAAEHKQIWEDIMELFDQLVEISGQEKMSLTDFAAVLGDGLDAVNLSLIPPGLDYVTVSSLDQNSMAGSRAIYILGANAGAMPRRIGEAGMFTDADRLHLADALEKMPAEFGEKPVISRGSQERSFGERFLLYRGFNEASEYLWISYALADAEGSGLQPASLVGKLKHCFPQLLFWSIPLEILDRKDMLQLSAPVPAVSGLANALRGQRDEGKMDEFWQDVYNWALKQPDLQRPMKLALAGLAPKAPVGEIPTELAQAIYLKGKFLRGSVTQFEKFRQCPFSHFAKYGLKLQERHTYEFRHMDLGQLLHEVIREYGEMVSRDYDHRWQDVPEERRGDICHELVETIAPRLQSEILLSRPDYRHYKRRMEATALQAVNHLSAWAAVSEFQPAYFEEGFGHKADKVQLTPLPLGNGFSLSLKGQIDRLDIHQENPYFLILDYKTGQAAINLFEVYYGLKLQLLVYVLVGQELLKQQDKERLPAGILYALLHNPLITADKRLSSEEMAAAIKKKLTMPGWVLADMDVIRSIDANLEHIKPQAKKDGQLDSNTLKKHYIRTQQEFELMLGYVDYILRDTGKAILSGDIQIKPYRNGERTACKYCDYQVLCGFDPDIEGFAYHDVQDFDEEEMERRMADTIGREDLADAIHQGSTDSH